MSRDYVRALFRHRDREFLISHLWQVTGFRQQAVIVEKLSFSPSTYSLRHRVEMAVKHMTTTSTRLLYLVLYLGILIFGLSIGVILYFLGRYFTSGIGVDGFTSQIISIWFLGGLITLILGILGIYIANIMAETKRRPYTIVRRIYRPTAWPPKSQAGAPRAWMRALNDDGAPAILDSVGGRVVLRVKARRARRNAAGRRLERGRFTRTASPAVSPPP